MSTFNSPNYTTQYWRRLKELLKKPFFSREDELFLDYKKWSSWLQGLHEEEKGNLASPSDIHKIRLEAQEKRSDEEIRTMYDIPQKTLDFILGRSES